MSSKIEGQRPPRGPPPPPPKSRRGGASLPTTSVTKYLMNDIPRGTPRAKLINSLLSPNHWPGDHMPGSPNLRPDVRCSILLADSRLDDELSVATIEFSGTPIWLQRQNQDPFGFPKKTSLGTLWRGVDTSAVDEHGQSAFIRAVIDGGLNLHFAEMLAEFAETDVNIQDEHGRTALHWACLEKLTDMVRLCLSVLQCDVSLKDNDGLTAFDLALRAAGANEVIPTVFYRSMFEIEQSDPQTALLRALTVSSEPAQGRSPFPGEAIFAPVHDCNTPLVKALIERGVDLTARNVHGDTALHVAATKVGNVEIAAMLLEAGADVNAIGNGGATPLHHAAQTTESQTMVELFLNWDADTAVRDIDDSLASDWASQTGQLDIARIIEDHDIGHRAGDTESIGLVAEDRLKDDSAAAVKQVPSVFPSEESLSASVKQVPSVVPSEGSTFASEKAFFQAVKDGDADVVQRLLSNGVEIEEKNEDSQTALLIAAFAGHTALVQILLSHKADIEAADHIGKTALHWAAEHGHTEMVQALLAHGALVDEVDQSKCTALHRAANYCSREVVRILLAAGAQPGIPNGSKRTALHLAAYQGSTSAVNVLLEYNAPVNVVDQSGDTPWDDAAAKRHLETMKALVMGGAKVRVIANADATDETLFQAVKDGNADAVWRLLSNGVDIEAKNKDRQTALLIAAISGHTEIVQILLCHKADIEAADRYGATALHQAANRGRTEIVQVLLGYGASIDAVNLLKWTALHYAAVYSHTKVVGILLAAGAQPGITDDNKRTPLHIAAHRGSTDVVNILLEYKAPVNMADKDGDTPWDDAAAERHLETMKALEAGGAKVRVITKANIKFSNWGRSLF